MYSELKQATNDDCARTVVACLLNKKDTLDVPDFFCGYSEASRIKFWRNFKNYLCSIGCFYVTIDCHEDEIIAENISEGLVMLIVHSLGSMRAWHAIVGRISITKGNNKSLGKAEFYVVHDPSVGIGYERGRIAMDKVISIIYLGARL